MEDQVNDQNNQTETQEELQEKKDLDIREYFGLDETDRLSSNFDKISQKIKNTLGFGLEEMGNYLSKWIQNNSEELCLGLTSIAPFGDYSKLIENNEEMYNFLRKNCKDYDVWDLMSISVVGQLFKFEFRCKATDLPPAADEESPSYNLNIVGNVMVGCKSKQIRHGFVQSN